MTSEVLSAAHGRVVPPPAPGPPGCWPAWTCTSRPARWSGCAGAVGHRQVHARPRAGPAPQARAWRGARRHGATGAPRGRPRPVQLVLQHPERAMNPRWRVRDVLAGGPVRTETSAPRPGGTGGSLVEPHLAGPVPARDQRRGAAAGEPGPGAARRSRRYLVADEISASLDAVTQALLWQHLLAQVPRAPGSGCWRSPTTARCWTGSPTASSPSTQPTRPSPGRPGGSPGRSSGRLLGAGRHLRCDGLT